MVQPAERRLVQAVQAGESEAVARLFERWWSPVWTFATARSAHRADAERLTAQIFASAMAHVGDWSGAHSLDAWMLAVAHHVAKRHQDAGAGSRPAAAVPARPGRGRSRRGA